MKLKNIFPLLFLGLVSTTIAESQVIFVPRGGGNYHPRPRRMIRRAPPVVQRQQPKFDPYVNISLAYGFPNLDKQYLPEYGNAYIGSISQTGPVSGSIDYRFSRNMSIGATVSHGMVSAPYYSYNNGSGFPDFNVKLDNWAFMLSLKSYMESGPKVSPYIRTSIGVNSWTQDFTDGSGNKLNMPLLALPDLAYQVSLGAEFKLSKNSRFFAEAGYGKYILQGGLSLKF